MNLHHMHHSTLLCFIPYMHTYNLIFFIYVDVIVWSLVIMLSVSYKPSNTYIRKIQACIFFRNEGTHEKIVETVTTLNDMRHYPGMTVLFSV